MNKQFSIPEDPRPVFIEFRPGMRRLIADAIESLILLLDEIDGDADLEEDDPAEDDGSAEPSLGSLGGTTSGAAWPQTEWAPPVNACIAARQSR